MLYWRVITYFLDGIWPSNGHTSSYLRHNMRHTMTYQCIWENDNNFRVLYLYICVAHFQKNGLVFFYIEICILLTMTKLHQTDLSNRKIPHHHYILQVFWLRIRLRTPSRYYGRSNYLIAEFNITPTPFTLLPVRYMQQTNKVTITS